MNTEGQFSVNSKITVSPSKGSSEGAITGGEKVDVIEEALHSEGETA